MYIIRQFFIPPIISKKVPPLETEEDREEYGIPPTMIIPVDIFIDFQTNLLLQDLNPQEYTITITNHFRECFKKSNVS